MGMNPAYLYLSLFLFELILLSWLCKKLQIALGRSFYLMTKSHNTSVILLTILFFPGTLIHEMAHALMAGVMLLNVGEIKLTPEIGEDSVKLGSVQIEQSDPFRRALVGVAPVIFGVGILISSLLYLFSHLEKSAGIPYSIWLIIIYIIFVITNTMFSSRKDLEGTLEVLVFIICIFLAFYILGFNQVFNYINNLFTPSAAEFLKKASLVLIIPILIDIFVWGLVKLISPKNQ